MQPLIAYSNLCTYQIVPNVKYRPKPLSVEHISAEPIFGTCSAETLASRRRRPEKNPFNDLKFQTLFSTLALSRQDTDNDFL